MKLRNKKTGDIYELNEFCLYDDKGFAKRPFLKSLTELNEEWEDYEEPKEYWYIRYDGCITITCGGLDDGMKQIGNYFETKEQAEKAVEKLKAWKRLKDKGFKFTNDLVYGEYYGCGSIRFSIYPPLKSKDVINDLNLLFGGEDA